MYDKFVQNILSELHLLSVAHNKILDAVKRTGPLTFAYKIRGGQVKLMFYHNVQSLARSPDCWSAGTRFCGCLPTSDLHREFVHL